MGQSISCPLWGGGRREGKIGTPLHLLFYNIWDCALSWILLIAKKSHVSQMSIIALWCYPNVNGSVRNLSLNTSTAPIFLKFNYFRENIWVMIWVQFHFLYIFVGRVDRTHKTSHITMLSFLLFPFRPPKFGDELNSSSKTAPANIWAHKNWSKYLNISNCVFTMNCPTDKKIVFGLF